MLIFVNSELQNKINKFKGLLEPPCLIFLSAATKALYDIFQDPACDEQTKQECLNQLIKNIDWRVRNSCFIDVLNEFINSLRIHLDASDEYSLSMMEFVRKVLNNPQVLDGFSRASVLNRYKYFICRVVENIERFFYAESIREILSKRTKNLITFVFGHHYSIVQDVELQKKWIKAYINYHNVEPVLGIRYITSEALESLPVEVSHAFIRKIINYISPSLMMHFNLETLKKIVIMYTVIYGSNKDSNYILRHIKEYRDIFVSY